MPEYNEVMSGLLCSLLPTSRLVPSVRNVSVCLCTEDAREERASMHEFLFSFLALIMFSLLLFLVRFFRSLKVLC